MSEAQARTTTARPDRIGSGSTWAQQPRSFLVWHNARPYRGTDGTWVFCDEIGARNQDPYVWNDPFLHSFCHLRQAPMTHVCAGDTIYWVNWEPGAHVGTFEHLYCDLVFVVGVPVPWRFVNHVLRRESVVDSTEAFADHYRWVHTSHKWKKGPRLTYKADARASFQPQTAMWVRNSAEPTSSGLLFDFVPSLAARGVSLSQLRDQLTSRGQRTRPINITAVSADLYARLCSLPVILRGDHLQRICPTTTAQRWAHSRTYVRERRREFARRCSDGYPR